MKDPKEQELIDARDEADRKWAEACFKRDKAYRELRKYQVSKAQQGRRRVVWTRNM